MGLERVRTLMIPVEDRSHTDCFAVAAQRWRPFPGDATQVQSYRVKALRKCRITDRGLRPKILFVRRNAATRRWRDEKAVLAHLKTWLEQLARDRSHCKQQSSKAMALRPFVAVLSVYLSHCHPGTWDGKVIMNENGAELPDLSGMWTGEDGDFQLRLFQPPTAPCAAPNSSYARLAAGSEQLLETCTLTPIYDYDTRHRLNTTIRCHGAEEDTAGYTGSVTNRSHVAWHGKSPWMRQEGTPQNLGHYATSKVKKVHVVFMNHYDVGYTDYINGVRLSAGLCRTAVRNQEGVCLAFLYDADVRRYMHKYYASAAATAQKMRASGLGNFTYTTHPWLMQRFLMCPCAADEGSACLARSLNNSFEAPLSILEAEEIANFSAAARRGDIAWNAAPFNIQPENMAPELFEASFDLAKRMDQRFGRQATRTMSIRDVIYVTRAVLPHLKNLGITGLTIGSNGADYPPQVPKLHRWVDELSGTDIVVTYHAYGYGGYGLKDCAEAPNGVALCTEFRTDNTGPPANGSDVLAVLTNVSKEYPGAHVISSTFDAFFADVQEVREQLPTVTLEVADTWTYGNPSDPLKMAQYRAIQRDSMLFPMYTVAVDVVLKMKQVRPHEHLKALGQLTIFDRSKTSEKAAFVSHQWVSQSHPDPDFRQMSVLQDVLRKFLSSSESVPKDQISEMFAAAAKALPMKEFQTCSLFIWYDYFSVPQKEVHKAYASDPSAESKQANAINSIPAYVANCHFFLALCPVLDCPREGKVLTASTWARRGWTRLERAVREMSPDHTWVLIQGSTKFELAGTVLSFPGGPVGEGDFTLQEDRRRLAPVMQSIIMQRMVHCLRTQDFPGFRRCLNLQHIHFSGFRIDPVGGLLPFSGQDAVSEFLHQNGLSNVNKSDSAGWWPLHYAALSGNTEVIKGLLQQRAALNQRTSKDEPTLGIPPWNSALDIAVLHRHPRNHEAISLLIAARARLEGGLADPVLPAAVAGNVEAVRLLCDAGGNPLCRDIFGFNALDAAATMGSLGAMQELVKRASPSELQLSAALHVATSSRGGSAELVHTLLALRADVDYQFNLQRLKPLGRMLYALKALQHRLGHVTALTSSVYHDPGSTPLMHAVRTAQYEAAAALIAAGANLELRNCRGFTAADLAKDASVPSFLQEGLHGNRVECQRVCSLALEAAETPIIQESL
ncbi:ANK2 [Symbiodinium microadriaticum]|nr:ANK2 [Symbiodinium microadriaticum]